MPSDKSGRPSPPLHQDYYQRHRLGGDRIALWYYARVIRSLQKGGGRVLDFGCGTGHLLRRLAPQFETYGYDASPYARAQSRMNAPLAVILEDWTTLLPDSLDAIVALHCLEHLAKPETVVARLAGLLRVGGLFFAVVPNPGGFGRRLKGREWFAYRDRTHLSLLSQGEWVTVLKRAGLQVSGVAGDGLWDAPYIRFVPAFAQRALFGIPAAVQMFWPLPRPFLPPAAAECLILQARRW